MTRSLRRLLMCAGLFVAALPGTVAAQFQVVGYGSGEWDTHHQAVYVLGLAGQTTNLGLGPAANLLFYDVQLPTTGSIRAINPEVGVQYRWTQSSLQGRAGYAFLSGDTLNVVGTNTFGGSRSGVTTTGQYENWGDGRRSIEVIGSVNWGSKYLWSTARAAMRVVDLTNGGLNLGAEVIGQGNSDFKTFQVGPMAQLQLGILRIDGVVGYKFRDDAFENGAYFRAGFVIVP